jgi:hypothetical protein
MTPRTLLVLLVLATPAAAVRVPGGAPAADACLAEVDVAGAAECTDCDPACDRDGVATPDGGCTFEVALCLGQQDDACTPAAPAAVRVRPPGALVVPPLDSAVCGPETAIRVRTRRRAPGRTTLRVRAATAGAPRRRDTDRVRLVCRPRPPGEPCPAAATRARCTDHDPLRRAFFGDLHVHTTQSFDAHAFDVETTPAEAYRFAQGEPLALPPLDADGHGTRTVALDRPLDFAAVTDHSEFLGEVETCATPGAPGYDSQTCQTYRGAPYLAVTVFGSRLATPTPTRFPDLCGPDGAACRATASPVWQGIVDAAEAADDATPACRFTTFIGYEYTAATNASTLHRNVIFRNATVPFPTTYFEQPTAAGLWRELRATCLDAGTGCDALAIPHNSNESNGRMFAVEYPGAATLDDQRRQAGARAAIEPLVEIYQHKGSSECFHGLAGIVGASDEQCAFEQEVRSPLVDCGDTPGNGGVARVGCYSRLDFVRGALLEGLREAARLGQNPYRLGIVASTDTHNGTPGLVDERTFGGHRGIDDDTPAKQLGHGVLTGGGIVFGPGGLVGAWAEENSRDSLFDAFRRREVFGTSGPRIAVRLFGGWNLPRNACRRPDMIAAAYRTGVPMGGVLPPRRKRGGTPRLLVAALRDPGTAARPGAPLASLQIVKGWLEDGTPREQVFDVATAGDGAAVDPETCATSGPGADALCTVWADPQFDARQHAFYYARVLENPTCRWSTWTCNALPAAERPPTCTDPSVPRTVQERAWSSPIWYRPASG